MRSVMTFSRHISNSRNKRAGLDCLVFNNTSADFALISVENDHNFEQNEDRATVILKWTDFRSMYSTSYFTFAGLVWVSEVAISLCRKTPPVVGSIFLALGEDLDNDEVQENKENLGYKWFPLLYYFYQVISKDVL